MHKYPQKSELCGFKWANTHNKCHCPNIGDVITTNWHLEQPSEEWGDGESQLQRACPSTAVGNQDTSLPLFSSL